MVSDNMEAILNLDFDLTVGFDSCIVQFLNDSISLDYLLENSFTGIWNLLLEYFKFYNRIFKKMCQTQTSGLSDFLSKDFRWIYWILT